MRPYNIKLFTDYVQIKYACVGMYVYIVLFKIKIVCKRKDTREMEGIANVPR